MSIPPGRIAPPFVPIGAQLLRRVLLVALFCAFVACAVQAVFVGNDARRSFEHAIKDVTSVHMAPLSAALWDIDGKQIQAHLDEIVSSDHIAGVRLITAAGIEFTAGALPPARDASLLAGGDHVAFEVKRLGGAEAPSAAPLGKLIVSFNQAFRARTILVEIGKTIVFIMVFTGALCVMLLSVLRSKVTVPLSRLREHVSRLTPETLGQPMPALRPIGKWRDEMDMVADGFQTLHSGIERFVGERNQAHEQLQRERDQLDATVRERTATLSRLNEFLAMISSVSMRFINTELAAYPAALRITLSELAELTGARRVCLAQRNGQGSDAQWFWHEFSAQEIRTAGAGFILPPAGGGMTVQFLDSATVAADWAPVLLAHGAQRAVVCRRDGDAQSYLLALLDQQGQALPEQQVMLLAETLFSTLARWRSLQEVEGVRADLTVLSNTDPLTGVANRRYFVSHRIAVAQQALAAGQGIAVIMVDIDHFKRYNDTYGHDAGDTCLVAVARAVAAALPPPILFARLGGEEFSAILACDELEAGVAYAEAARKAVQALAIKHVRGANGRVSISLGVSFVRHTESEPAAVQIVIEGLMRQADQALYRSKRAGRNTVSVEHAA